MSLNNYYFRFSLLGTVLAIAGLALFGSLGVWQTYRAIEKQALQDEMDIKVQLPPFVLNDAVDDLDGKKFLKTEASGVYDKDNIILLDNIVQDGVAGYYVMAPFILETSGGGTQTIMVNRGWVPVGRDRKILPELETPTGEIQIQGVLAPPRSKPPLILVEPVIEDKVWPYYDGERYAERIGRKVLPVIMLLSENDPYGYVRQWPKYETKVGMHIGYAIQWYVFALIVVATYFGLNIKKREVDDNRTNDE